MSQEKVNKNKQAKYARKNAPRKSKIKSICAYTGATILGIAFVVYLGYSVAVSTGLYSIPETTTAFASTVSAKDLRKTLIQDGDSNVKGDTSTETTTQASEEATTAK